MESEADEQLIFHIPYVGSRRGFLFCFLVTHEVLASGRFTASIKLKAINIIGGSSDSSPSKLKAYGMMGLALAQLLGPTLTHVRVSVLRQMDQPRGH